MIVPSIDMETYPYQISEMMPNFGFALAKGAAKAVEDNLPELLKDFPPFSQFNFQQRADDELCIVIMDFKDSGIPCVSEIELDRFNELKSLIGEHRTFEELKHINALKAFFGWNEFLLALDVDGTTVDWYKAQANMFAWLNDAPLARAQQMNLTRVRSAIPPAPNFAFSNISPSLWVFESEITCLQGTAFDLNGFGTITNHHVVNGGGVFAFRALNPAQKFEVEVMHSNEVLDLAIVKVQNSQNHSLLVSENDDPKLLSHIAVCGFPNYRLGDSGVMNPGLVIGTRPKSGVVRLLTNASIVAGMSGGPAIGADGKVVGICVTGSKTFKTAGETEDHAIVPVSALEILLS